VLGGENVVEQSCLASTKVTCQNCRRNQFLQR
jgi:hypothetical protein